MELTEVSKKIEEKIKLLEMGRTTLKDKAEFKARTEAEYDKMLAITIIKLKNGEEVELEEQKIKDVQATLIEKIAKGVCWKEKLAMIQAEAEYKVVLSKMNCIQAELNGFQSIFRHQTEV